MLMKKREIFQIELNPRPPPHRFVIYGWLGRAEYSLPCVDVCLIWPVSKSFKSNPNTEIPFGKRLMSEYEVTFNHPVFTPSLVRVK